MEEKSFHKSALLKEVVDCLDLKPKDIILDLTIGTGGHAERILKDIGPSGKLIGIDKDIEALEIAHKRLEPFLGQFILINRDFRYIKDILREIHIEEVSGILLDLGISSLQIDRAERGFSIRGDGPLDMRMNREDLLTAKYLVNNLTELELSHLLRDLGEEKFHRKIAKKIIEARKKKEIETTGELAKIVTRCFSFRKRTKIHPATRTFQAFRIKVNDELASLDLALREAPGILKKGGRICVISFQSLEDRIVKLFMREFSKVGILKILTPSPITPAREEILENPRSRSAKMRVAMKI